MNNQEPYVDLSKIRMSSVEVISFQIRNGLTKTFYKRNIKGVDYKFDTEFGYNLEDKLFLITINTHIEVVHDEPTEDNIGGECKIEFTFEVDNIDEYFIGDESKILEGGFGTDVLFVYTLVGLSFSTARGIIFSRSLGTMLDGLLLPIIAPKELLVKR